MTKKHLLALTLLSISIFLAYSNSLNGTWAMDDIVTSKPVALKDIKDFIGFRKVAYITFFLNQLIAPFNPLNFRLMNILIHILNTALVYIIAYRTILLCTPLVRENTPLNPPLLRGKLKGGTPVKGKSTIRLPLMNEEERGDKKLAFYAALFSGVLFGLHPININAVAYIVQRMASMATLFVLIALLCYIFAAQANHKKKSLILYASCGISIVAGIFSKENAVMAIPLILIYDYVFISHLRGNLFRKRLLLVCGLGIFSIGLAFYLLKMHSAFVDVVKFFFNPNQPLTEKGWMARDVYWTSLQHVLTEFRVVSRYLFVILFPLPKFLIFDWWGFPVSQSLIQPITTLFSAMLILSLLFFSVWKIKRFPLLCFGILWYFIAILLESFIALGSDLYFEHRNYLPTAGLFTGIAGQSIVSVVPKLSKNVVVASIITCGIVLGVLTFSRNFVWKDSLTLWGDTLQKVPSNIRAMMGMGNAYLKISDTANAEKYYMHVVQISSQGKYPSFFNEAAYSLGMVYLYQGKLEQARVLTALYEQSIESYRPRILKGFYKALSNDVDGALTEYNEIVKEADGIDRLVIYTLMGDAYRGKGLWDKAIEKYEQAVAIDQTFADAYYGIGAAYMAKRDHSRAYEYFGKTISLDPYHVLALSDMSDLLLITKKNPGEALTYAQRAISKSPPFYQPYLSMGNVLIVLRKETEAEEFYKKAIERGVAEYMIAFSKARAYYLRGDSEKAKEQIAELRKFKNLPEQIKNLIIQK